MKEDFIDIKILLLLFATNNGLGYRATRRFGAARTSQG